MSCLARSIVCMLTAEEELPRRQGGGGGGGGGGGEGDEPGDAGGEGAGEAGEACIVGWPETGDTMLGGTAGCMEAKSRRKSRSSED
jgi:hypothetical protein